MEEPQKKLSQRHEGRPRKVRFKISSAYSGRVLKQVFEDGQELELPAKEHSRRVVRHCFEPGERWAGELPEGRRYPPAKLSAQRISIFKEGQTLGLGSTSPLLDCQPGDSRCKASPVLDFGKIIIYTNNLKIIRAPMDQKELMRRIVQTEGINDWAFIYREKKERFGSGHRKDVEKKVACNQHMQEGDAEHGCSQCKGSGSAPCSLCHGSKFSMLANRFRESYRALRCPACNESGLQPCQICAA
ncbi:PREDICTED: glutaredoxin domain-containing cysteine-rich protein 2 [Nestor notabilis]|uniref:Glutaredoxin domain-containing cysteine-rich protein 2 n=1 Tax=Nestor notabilis TaxID=176057 RepID=A0A091RX49_NESNO|nr:PREDICTED: glutaredoxin domain-containing cysteine-rich protein 2 [Nestor notabilis]KFQ46754.1 Glutaredoxin domain-containing cysteine-rich protein 2 [Nestor notabilis]